MDWDWDLKQAGSQWAGESVGLSDRVESRKKGQILRQEIYDCIFCKGTGERPPGSKCPVCKGKGAVRVKPPAMVCAFCKGRGEDQPRMALPCSVCKGKGIVSVQEPIKTCPTCGGKGRPRGSALYCMLCKGKGVIRVKTGKKGDRVTVRRPGGTEWKVLEIIYKYSRAGRVKVGREMCVSNAYAEYVLKSLLNKQLIQKQSRDIYVLSQAGKMIFEKIEARKPKEKVEEKKVEEIWSHKTNMTFSISVSEEGDLAFSDETKSAGFIRVYNQKDNSFHAWEGSSIEKVVASGNYVFAACDSNIISLFQIRPGKQLWARRVDSLSSFSLDYSYEAKRGVVGNIPMDSKLNPAASTIWVFDQNGDVIWRKKLDAHLTCAVINQKGYVVATGEKFGSLDKNLNYTKGENAVYVFDPSGKLLANVQFDSPPIDVGIDKDGERIAVGLDDGGMAFLNGDGKILWEKDNIGGYIAISEQGEKIVTTKSTHFVLLNEEGKVLWESPQKAREGLAIEGLIISPKGKYIGIGTFDSAVAILEAASGKVLYQTKPGKKIPRVSLSDSYAGIAIKDEVKLLSLK